MKPYGQWVLTVMKSRWRDLSPIQISCNYNYSLITHNKTLVHSNWGLLRVCAACPTPRLNLSSRLCPSSERHPRYVRHRVRTRYNSSAPNCCDTEQRSASQPACFLPDAPVCWSLCHLAEGAYTMRLFVSVSVCVSSHRIHLKFRCNILISGKIIKEMPGSVASGTSCIIETNY